MNVLFIILTLLGLGLIFVGSFLNRRGYSEGAAVGCIGFILTYASILVYSIIN